MRMKISPIETLPPCAVRTVLQPSTLSMIFYPVDKVHAPPPPKVKSGIRHWKTLESASNIYLKHVQQQTL